MWNNKAREIYSLSLSLRQRFYAGELKVPGRMHCLKGLNEGTKVCLYEVITKVYPPPYFCCGQTTTCAHQQHLETCSIVGDSAQNF